jgi:leucine dehydrogenase
MSEATAMPVGTGGIFDQISTLDHEQVMFCHDKATGLRAIIGIHNSVLGSALGGLRFWNYNNDSEALFDVLRLSRGMTFKAALSGVNLGGGKAVIIGDPRKIKSEALLRRFGQFVQNLGGKYITAEDVGVSEQDMVHISQETDHVTGLPENRGGSGDPSPVTAYGVYLGMKAALKFQTGSESLQNKKVIVQGAGKVGTYLIENLAKEGAKIFVYDIISENIKNAVDKFKAVPIDANEIYSLEADIYAPCALGATINPDTIPQLKVSLVCGGANNQLLDEKRDGLALQSKNILYAPDFMVNAGGLINVYTELDGYVRARAIEMTELIYKTTLNVLNLAREEKITPHEAALKSALMRIESVGRIRQYM